MVLIFRAYNSLVTTQNKNRTEQYYEEQNKALALIKENIIREMNNFNYETLRNRTNATSLQELNGSSNKSPVVNVIITTFRSGSNFMEDMINSFPATYAHHETLWHYGPLRIRDRRIGSKAINDMREMLHCNFSLQEKFLNAVKYEIWPINRNERVWNYLNDEKKYSLYFLTNACKQFPFHVMKLTRLLLRDAEALLEDDTFNLKMIFLVRDPRGMILSRWDAFSDVPLDINYDWNNPKTICGDMMLDYTAASNFMKKYPDRFTVVRYEDFASQVFQEAPKLFNFLQLPFHDQVKKFLKDHTKATKGDAFSTYRHTKATVFRWTKDITWNQTQIVQKDCSGAMKLWGYKFANTEEELKNNFYPLYDFDYTFN